MIQHQRGKAWYSEIIKCNLKTILKYFMACVDDILNYNIHYQTKKEVLNKRIKVRNTKVGFLSKKNPN